MLASVLTGNFLELVALFAIVFVHEMGHIAAAKWCGITVLSVQMLPFGGVAVMEDTGHLSGWREISIALAGPLQNVILILVAWIIHLAGLWDGFFLTYFIHCNLLIALFNLLPILPLDGGKISQSLFSMMLPYHTTLLWTTRISMLFSGFVIVYAIIPVWLHGTLQLNLLLIGLFLLYSNMEDYRHLHYRFIRFLMNRNRLFAKHLMKGSIALPIITDASKPLDKILRLFRREKYHLVYVMNHNGQIVAVVPEQRLIASYLTGDPSS